MGLFPSSLVIVLLVIQLMRCHASSHGVRHLATRTPVGVLPNVIQVPILIRQGALHAVQIHHVIVPSVVSFQLFRLWNRVSAVLFKDIESVRPRNQRQVNVGELVVGQEGAAVLGVDLRRKAFQTLDQFLEVVHALLRILAHEDAVVGRAALAVDLVGPDARPGSPERVLRHKTICAGGLADLIDVVDGDERFIDALGFISCASLCIDGDQGRDESPRIATLQFIRLPMVPPLMPRPCDVLLVVALLPAKSLHPLVVHASGMVLQSQRRTVRVRAEPRR
mmetsp:Transcript_14513/g.40013  ORF Transcript_14513/g.40013 Transcript_14513/m.40013 type:complete len:279 (+) Transcript_14513:1233-2069(+)